MTRYFLFAVIFGTLFTACDSKDDPVIENEEEVITDVIFQLTPAGGGAAIILTYSDPDGDGAGQGTTTVSDTLAANTTYDGVVFFTNASDPNNVENVSVEVQQEGVDHQIFLIPDGMLDMTFTYVDTDANGDPVGLFTEVQTGEPSAGTLQLLLRHEPDKAAGATISDPANAGGETDVAVTYPVVIGN